MKLQSTLLLLLFTSILIAQKKQPKVGLVLSGGGAKGFAHIGVLKEIDKAGIQIDYIGGTSMGAIVGGLYATGLSGKEIEKVIKNTDFVQLLRDKLPRNTEPFFEKEFGEKTNITLPVTKGKIGFPRGISKGQNVLNLLCELLDSAENIDRFSELPIPFFAVATDVETGNGVLLEEGSLALAMRASGSFPTLLNPVPFEEKLLVDGGIANNFPVSIMKEKGMDIIIGVDVEGRLFDKKKLKSAIDILNQIVSYQMYSKTDEEKKKLDVYIHPDIYQYNVVDFDKKKEILKIGDDTAKEFTKVFEEIAKKQTNKRKLPKRKPLTKKRISKIEVFGSKYYTKAYVLGKMNLKDGDEVDRREISSKIDLLSATKNYERIEYTLKKDKEDGYVISFFLTESEESASLGLGLHYDLLYKSGLLANYEHKHLLSNNDLFSFNVVLGDNIRYDLNYFVDNGFYVSYGLSSRFNSFQDNVRFNLSLPNQPTISNINLNYTDFTNQLFLQTTFNRKFAIGLGAEHKYIRATTQTILTNNEVTIIDDSNYLNLYSFFKLDTYDKKYFVDKGFYADLNLKWFLSSSDHYNDFQPFALAKGTVGFATKISDKFTFQNTNELGHTFRNTQSDIFNFYLGGYNQNYINTFVSLYGYDFADLNNKSFLKTEVNFRYNFAKNQYAMFIANFARLDENIFKDIEFFDDILSGYALGYSYNSLIGPIELKYSWSPDTGKSHILFNLGFWF